MTLELNLRVAEMMADAQTAIAAKEHIAALDAMILDMRIANKAKHPVIMVNPHNETVLPYIVMTNRSAARCAATQILSYNGLPVVCDSALALEEVTIKDHSQEPLA